ncbi:hypothetical protein L3i23_02500 [Herbiconiux sp. L3-i23]|nr:hypothetical protein L3i23_02500 [Herbiconiux sp. L3-i23]
MYILECSDATLYVGSTSHLEMRIRQHLQGEGAAYTRSRRPVRLLWVGEFDRVDDAFAFEKKLQGWSRAKKIALIEAAQSDRFKAASRRGVRPSTSHVSTAHLPTIDIGV